MKSLFCPRLKLYQDREKCVDSTSTPELEQLRVFLDEKDKHISDLMNTLKNFHVSTTYASSRALVNLIFSRTISNVTLMTHRTIQRIRLLNWPQI